ncbi:GTP-dependent nucleic acid-binding protein EngD [endosymbiont DhMRE of Dentiscutata heterogama]|uniref:redox-regulated ATPase YchF n=1 Tax=endosymbiont DhMRE of Dentiscutata heterogama TaxID=1609546 RepID=UPI000629DBAF|nr:redox-regulated ATPase YchF [endosymbiont DhMRE of Dentiscutata heterogama]CFW92894.1 GTP-dependent nucleic acid-binding protein EngD [endosymbiont DhMRE of Dentiscutata heterogama]
MSHKIGLIGLPNVGKSTLFNFLTKKDILIANYPFATITPNVGIMLLADSRLEKLSKYWQSKKTTPSVIEIVDIAGLVKGAAQGSGLGNEFLSHIREVDLICQVLRCFPDQDIVHVEKSVNPIRDWEIIQLELIEADLQQIERKLTKLKIRDEKAQREKNILQSIQEKLTQEIPVSQLDLSTSEKELIKGYNFLTNKPILLLANYSGEEKEVHKLREYAKKKGLFFFPLAVKLEGEMTELSAAEKKELGWQDTDLSLLTEKIKELLNLKVFFTAGAEETKSWLAKKEMTARECAGLIHTDIQKNFIRLEVYNYIDWLTNSNEIQLRKLGKIRREGSQYIVKEGDICHFLFGKG